MITNDTIRTLIASNDLRTIQSFDVSNVTNLSGCFEGMNVTGIDLSGWDTSNVTNMSRMFKDCTFGYDISVFKLNTLMVTNMSQMFEDCVDFNRNITAWDTAKVTNMSHMFENCGLFYQDIGHWATGNVVDMSYMFYKVPFVDTEALNSLFKTLTTRSWGFQWDTSNVENMSFMFGFETVWGDERVSNFNKHLNWDTSNVTTMRGMFRNCVEFNKPINWNTSNVTDMSGMFCGCEEFNQDISRWNTRRVVDMSDMFLHCYEFDCDLSVWDTSSVQNTTNMFDRKVDPNKIPILKQPPDAYKMVKVETSKGPRIGHLIFNNHYKYAVIIAIQKFLYTLDQGAVVPTKDPTVMVDYNDARRDWAYVTEDIETQVKKMNDIERTRSPRLVSKSGLQGIARGTVLGPQSQALRILKDYIGGKRKFNTRRRTSKFKTRNRL